MHMKSGTSCETLRKLKMAYPAWLGLPSISWVAGRADPEMALWSHGVLGGGYTVLT